MTSNQRDIVVFIWLPGKGYTPAALLTEYRTEKYCTLGYGQRYIRRPDAIPLDPASFPLTMSGPITNQRGKKISALRDAAPDKWGRKVLGLMAGQHAATLTETDILIATHSHNRIGALAFGQSASEGPKSMAPWAADSVFSAPKDNLEQIARVVAKVDELDDDDDLNELRTTLPEDAFMQALASSLSVGGGRPKVLVEMEDGDYIAKFSKRGDPWNEPRIEHATMTLAAQCGISVAHTRMKETSAGSILLVKRFDRTEQGEPRHFISGFTLNPNISEEGDWGSYQDLAQLARQHEDTFAGPELFRRMVFNALCSNVDDHPRNHAWFVGPQGINITPVYDVVPTQTRFREYALALRCGKEGRRATLPNVLSWPEPFGLRPDEAKDIAMDIVEIMSGWQEHFASCGVTTRDISELEYRFALLGAR